MEMMSSVRPLTLSNLSVIPSGGAPSEYVRGPPTVGAVNLEEVNLPGSMNTPPVSLAAKVVTDLVGKIDPMLQQLCEVGNFFQPGQFVCAKGIPANHRARCAQPLSFRVRPRPKAVAVRCLTNG